VPAWLQHFSPGTHRQTRSKGSEGAQMQQQQHRQQGQGDREGQPNQHATLTAGGGAGSGAVQAQPPALQSVNTCWTPQVLLNVHLLLSARGLLPSDTTMPDAAAAGDSSIRASSSSSSSSATSMMLLAAQYLAGQYSSEQQQRAAAAAAAIPVAAIVERAENSTPLETTFSIIHQQLPGERVSLRLGKAAANVSAQAAVRLEPLEQRGWYWADSRSSWYKHQAQEPWSGGVSPLSRVISKRQRRREDRADRKTAGIGKKGVR